MPIANLQNRALLHVSGPEARAFLQGLLTHDLTLLAPARPLWAALLSPQGKVLFDMILFDDHHGNVLVDCEAARADDLARRLTMYRLRRALTIERSPIGVLAAWGPHRRAGWPNDPRLADLGQRSPGYPVAGTADADADTDADADVYRAHRILLGVPEGAAELGIDKTLWLEANAVELNGVSFDKGCYVGQENTARMHHRDRVRRRLLPVMLTRPPGDERTITAGGRSVGDLRAFTGERGIAYLRVEDARLPLLLGGAPIHVRWPTWLGDGAPDGAAIPLQPLTADAG